MTRDDIYDHLAQVYLGKRRKEEEKRSKQFNAWLVINTAVTFIIFASAFYGLTAFLTRQGSFLEDRIIFSLHNGPIRFAYDFNQEYAPVKSFTIAVPDMTAQKYEALSFTSRAREEGNPGILKVVVRNQRNETAAVYIRGIGDAWQEYHLPLADFEEITDWTTILDVSFVLESWNVEQKKGLVLIDNLNFSS